MAIEALNGFSEKDVLLLAASLDQMSKHPIAQAIVAAAQADGLVLQTPGQVSETPGEGVAGRVGAKSVLVGGVKFVRKRLGLASQALHPGTAGAVSVAVGVDGKLAGWIVMADPLRAEMPAFLSGLRRLGVARIVLATGDRAAVAEAVTDGLGLDLVRADLTPDGKVMLVLSERMDAPVMMVGDGINDAPALAAANLGVAMGARGAAASAEAADVVLLVDQLHHLLPGIGIAKGARAIAVQSVAAGIGLSLAGMIAAAFGLITPLQGALFQEVIDVAVVLNALRVLRIAPDPGYEAPTQSLAV